MKPAYRVWFLIIVACFQFKLSDWQVVFVLVGYGIAEAVDWWLYHRYAKKARNEVFEDVLYGWEPSNDSPEYEEKGGLTRVRLTGQNQILAARIGDILLRLR
jgi:hypothetical protein